MTRLSAHRPWVREGETVGVQATIAGVTTEATVRLGHEGEWQEKRVLGDGPVFFQVPLRDRGLAQLRLEVGREARDLVVPVRASP